MKNTWANWIPVAASLLVVAMIGTIGETAFGSKTSGSANDVYVAPDGSAQNDGSIGRPFDLKTALSGSAPGIVPGATVWLRGGTYQGVYLSRLTGTASAPITVRQYPGERAVIDSAPVHGTALWVEGAWTVYWGFEVTNSDTGRVSHEAGSLGNDLKRGDGVVVHGANTKFINLIIHDTTQGFGIWADADNAEAYGNIIYNNGWLASDRSHGHGIYTQSKNGNRRLIDNILFNQFSHGIHAYGSSAAYLDNITLQGNISFDNGNDQDGKFFVRNILLGGGRSAQSPVVESNYTYYPARVRTNGDNNIGYVGGCQSLIARDNYWVNLSGGSSITLAETCGGTIEKNVFYGPVAAPLKERYADNTFLEERPYGLKVFVRPNRYEAGRAHIAVYNWDKLRDVRLDLSTAGIRLGWGYEIRDVQNLFGEPLKSGVYDGRPVTVRLTGLVATPPLGFGAFAPHTAPEFAALLLVSRPATGRLAILTGAMVWLRRTFDGLASAVGVRANASS